MALLEPLTESSVHIAIDMQRLFAEETDWHAPALAAILPNVVRLAEARPEATLYARFLVPPNAAAAKGRWKRYYERWSSVTGEALPPGMLDLVAPLARLASPERLIDKYTYSIFEADGLDPRLRRNGVDTILFSGVETDICVLASLMGAVDRGYRVIAIADAMASASAASHDAVLEHLLSRLPEQVEIADTEEVLGAFRWMATATS